jgi:hypothetical protein
MQILSRVLVDSRSALFRSQTAFTPPGSRALAWAMPSRWDVNSAMAMKTPGQLDNGFADK